MVNEVDESILFTDFVSRISKGTIYTRFIRPDDLFQFILGQVTEPWMERNIFKFSMNRYQRDPTPPREKIKASLACLAANFPPSSLL